MTLLTVFLLGKLRILMAHTRGGLSIRTAALQPFHTSSPWHTLVQLTEAYWNWNITWG